jgi:hypothetical protein
VALRRCAITGETYLMACCPRCGTGQGDGAVDKLLTSLHPRILVRVPIPGAPLTFRPLDGQPPRTAALEDWRERVVPAWWRLEPGGLDAGDGGFDAGDHGAAWRRRPSLSGMMMPAPLPSSAGSRGFHPGPMGQAGRNP